MFFTVNDFKHGINAGQSTMSKDVLGKNSNHNVLLLDVVVGTTVFFDVFLGCTVFPSKKSISINKHRVPMVVTIETEELVA